MAVVVTDLGILHFSAITALSGTQNMTTQTRDAINVQLMRMRGKALSLSSLAWMNAASQMGSSSIDYSVKQVWDTGDGKKERHASRMLLKLKSPVAGIQVAARKMN
jgi:hypothetical protein